VTVRPQCEGQQARRLLANTQGRPAGGVAADLSHPAVWRAAADHGGRALRTRRLASTPSRRKPPTRTRSLMELLESARRPRQAGLRLHQNQTETRRRPKRESAKDSPQGCPEADYNSPREVRHERELPPACPGHRPCTFYCWLWRNYRERQCPSITTDHVACTRRRVGAARCRPVW
jgi:hypothetical protein